MLTGAKIGSLIGRKRAFSIGCVIYGLESALAILAFATVLALFSTRRLPRIQPADEVAGVVNAPLTPAAAPPSPA